MGKDSGLQRKDIISKIDSFNLYNKNFAKVIIIGEHLAEQMAELIQDKQEGKKDAIGNIYLNVIYSHATYANCIVIVSPIASLDSEGVLIG